MSEFLVAEKNSSETDNTASHPTLEIDTDSQGSTNSKTNHKTGKRHKKITSKKNLDLHLFFNQHQLSTKPQGTFGNTLVVTWSIGVKHGVLSDQHARGRVLNKGLFIEGCYPAPILPYSFVKTSFIFSP